MTEPSFIEYDHSELHSKQGARNVKTKSSILEQSERVSTSLSQLFEHFLSDYIPQGGKAQQDPPVHWLQTVQNTGNLGNNTSLPLAITALSLVRLGRKHQNVELQNEGMAVYGQALEGIQAILSSDDLIFEEQTLASCMTLLVFEVSPIFHPSYFVGAVHSDMQTRYSKHQARIYGDGWVISREFLNSFNCVVLDCTYLDRATDFSSVSGPLKYISIHPSLNSTDWLQVIYALATRRSSYLGDEEWLTIPWQRVRKSDFHHLLDIMARMPDLIERTELALSMDAILPSSTEMDSLRERYWAIERQLRTWYINLVDLSTTPLLSETSPRTITSATQSDLQPLTDSSLNFPSFELARMHLFYWAALLLIYNNLISIPSPSTSLHQFPQVHLQSGIHTTATLIARSITYLLSPETQTMGPQNVFFPLRIAMHAFSELGEDREERWCRDVFEELDQRGFSFGRILANVKWDDIPRFLYIIEDRATNISSRCIP